MKHTIYNEVMAMDNIELAAAVAEEIYGYKIKRWEDGEPFMIEECLWSSDRTGLLLDPVRTGFLDDKRAAWSLVGRLRELAAKENKDSDPLMDRVSLLAAKILGIGPASSTAEFLYTGLFNTLTPKMLTQACVIGLRSWKLDPEGW